MPATCPSPHDLQRYALGQVAEAEAREVEAHLQRCDRCLASLSTLRGRDTLLDAVRAQARRPAPPDDPTVTGVIGRLKALPAAATGPFSAEDATLPPRGEPAEEWAPGGLLAPPLGPDEIGRLGPYRVLEVLGAGGMGAVFRAIDPSLQRPVALKVMLPGVAASPSARARFLREARLAAAVKHDHIVTIYQVGEVPAGGGTIPYLAMELLHGEPLDARLRREGKLPTGDALRIAAQVARGLAAAHARKLIHRDIKPANIWLEAPESSRPAPRDGQPLAEREAYCGRAKILDFGLARGEERSSAGGSELTQPGAILGTPAYMAPEQVDGHGVDARADLFSLGCVLYAMVTGRPPFSGRDTVSTLMAVATDRPTPPDEVNPDVPPALSELILRLLDKDPNRRPAGAAEVADALERIARGEAPAVGPRPARPRRRVLLAAAVAGLVLGLVALGVVVKVKLDGGREVVVRTDDPDIELVVKGGGSIVRIRDNKSGKTWDLDAGAYTLGMADDAGGLRIALPDGVAFVLERRGKAVLSIQRLAPAVPADGLKQKDIPQAALAWPGGGDPGQAPLELVGILGDGRFRTFGVTCFPAWSPDHQLLAVPAGDAVFVFDSKTGAFKHRLLEHSNRVVHVAFSTDGSLLASGGCDRTVRIWSTTTWESVHTLAPCSADHSGLAFHPDGRALAASFWDGTVRLWDSRSGKLLGEARGHEGPATGLAFRPAGKLLVSASRGAKGTVRTWDTSAGKLQPGKSISLVSDEDDYARAAFSPDGKVLAVGTSESVRLLDPESLAQQHSLPANASGLLAFAAGGRELLTAGHRYPGDTSSHHFERWDLAHRRKIASRRLATRGVWCHPVASPGGKTLAVTVDDQTVVRLFDAATGKPRVGDPGHANFVVGLAFSPDGKTLASGGNDYTVRLWDMATARSLLELTGHTARVAGVAFSPDGKLLASSSHDGTVRLWDLPGGRPAGTLTGFREGATKLAFSPAGRLVAAGGFDRTVRVWRVADRRQVLELNGFSEGVEAVAFSPDGKWLAAGSNDRTVRLYSVADGKLRRTVKHSAGVLAVVFLADSDSFLVGDRDGVIRRWSIRTGTGSPTMRGSPFEVFSVAVTPGGRFIATGGGDGARLWDGKTSPPRRRTFHLFSSGFWTHDVAFTPEGRYLATANPDGTVYVFKVPAELPERELGDVRPLTGGARAPDLSRAKRLYQDTFGDANSGFGSGADPFVKWGYAGGKYFMELQPGRCVGRQRGPHRDEVACEVVGRVTGHATGAWGLFLHSPRGARGIRILVDGLGRWSITPSPWDADAARGPHAGPLAHRAIKKGKEANRLLVVARGSRIEVYVNGEAVCEPIVLERATTPTEVGLFGEARAEKTTVEFERFTEWSADGLPQPAPGKNGKR
jgi:WD40 repeat protein/serine/threonine protein kinase